MKCPRCGAKNSNDAKYCVKCQCELKRSGVKICPKCKKKYTSEAEYCPLCQTELIYKGNSIVKYFVIGAISAVVIAGSVFAGVYIYPRVALSNALKNENTKKIVRITESHPKLILESKYKIRYSDLIDKTADEYINEEEDYNATVEDFDNFFKIDENSPNKKIIKQVDEKADLVKRVYDSREAFEIAETAYNDKDYKTAEENYPLVIEEDKKNYEKAREAIKEIADLKSKYKEDAENLCKNGDYNKSIDTYREGITLFGYDEEYKSIYHDGIINTVVEYSKELAEEGDFFAYDEGNVGAFNLVYSYLKDADFSDSDILKSRIKEIATESNESEYSRAYEKLKLTNMENALNRLSETAAKAYYSDRSIMDNPDYFSSLCGANSNDAGFQDLILSLPEDKEIKAALVADIAMNADDFVKMASEKLLEYSNSKIDYSGIGRYYDEEKMEFSWAIIIIYE